MQYKNTKKIILDQRKLEILFRIGCPDNLIIELLKTGTFTPTGDSLIDDNLESLIDHKIFNNNNWGGKREGAGRPRNNQDKNQDKIQVKNQDTDKDIDKEYIEYIENNSLVSGIREKRFIPPTEKELLEYAKTMNEMAGAGGFECSRYTAEQFWSHYESCKWIVGNGIPMWNWKAKLKEWCIKNKQNELKKEY